MAEEFEPLTDEQLYGDPDAGKFAPVPEGTCPYEKITCPAWDIKQGCLAKGCVQKIAAAPQGE